MELGIKIKNTLSKKFIDVAIISGYASISFELLDEYERTELVNILKQAIIDIEAT